MKFSEAKQRKDYKFTLNEIEDLIEDIRNNYMKNLYENGDGTEVQQFSKLDMWM